MSMPSPLALLLPADPAQFLKGSALFALGALAQTVLLLREEWRPAEVLRVLGYSAASLAIPAALIRYSTGRLFSWDISGLYFLLTLTGFAWGVAWRWRARLLPRVNELTLTSCAITGWYAFLAFVYRGAPEHKILAAGLALPTLATLLLAASHGGLRRGWKVFFFSWYLALLVWLLAWQFSFGHLLAFFTGRFYASSGALFLSGMAFCMGMIYLEYLGILSPFWTHTKKYSLHYKVERELFVDLALAGFDANGGMPRAVALPLLAAQALFFAAVHRYGLVSPETAVNAGILLPMAFAWAGPSVGGARPAAGET